MQSNETTKLYPIQEVSQSEHGELSVWIHFKMNHRRYEMEIRKQPTYTIQNIYHHNRDPRDPCPHCNRDMAMCYGLTKEKEAIFKEISLHPAIRLYWVGRKPFIE